VYVTVGLVDTAPFTNPSAAALHHALGLLTVDGRGDNNPAAPVADGVWAELADLLSSLDRLSLPTALFESLNPEQAQLALVAVNRLRCRVDATIVVLSQSLQAGRDTVAAVTRATNMSNSSARHYARVARQREAVPEIVDRLTDGALSLEHASALASTDADTARTLIDHATRERVDEFRCRVRKTQVDKAGRDRRARQLAERSVRFSTTEEGSVRATIVLPDAEGTEFKATLELLADTAYRKNYPERATTLGGHHPPPKEQRIADALVEWMRSELKGPGRPAVVVVIDAETLDCTRLPNDPISKQETAELLNRANVYGLIRDHTTDEVIRFGRNRRLASATQKLLLSVIHGYCATDGCYEPALGADADHITRYSRGGRTDIEGLQPKCGLCHPHKTLTEHNPNDPPNEPPDDPPDDPPNEPPERKARQTGHAERRTANRHPPVTVRPHR
jgi:hypothetical protein